MNKRTGAGICQVCNCTGPVFVEFPIDTLYPYELVAHEAGITAGKTLGQKLVNMYVCTVVRLCNEWQSSLITLNSWLSLRTIRWHVGYMSYIHFYCMMLRVALYCHGKSSICLWCWGIVITYFGNWNTLKRISWLISLEHHVKWIASMCFYCLRSCALVTLHCWRPICTVFDSATCLHCNGAMTVMSQRHLGCVCE